MNRLDEPRELNRDALINEIYRIQADLTMLAEQLARERNPDLNDWTLMGINGISNFMRGVQPSLYRH